LTVQPVWLPDQSTRMYLTTTIYPIQAGFRDTFENAKCETKLLIVRIDSLHSLYLLWHILLMSAFNVCI